MVLTFAVAYLTEDALLSIHTFAGYVILGLLSLRLVWGFIGPQYARFSDFTYSPSSIRKFLKDIVRFRARRYLGHNPAGGAMILLLLTSLLLTSFTGMAIYAAAERAGPLAEIFKNTGEFIEEVLEETHEFFSNVTLFLIFIHIAGVVIESLIHRENLTRTIVTGYKRALDTTEEN